MIDLGSAPPSNAYLTAETMNLPELWLPLRVMVCQQCWLAQTQDFVTPEVLFDEDYAYFSATSSSWLAHAELLVADAVSRFAVTRESRIVEIACNDGYLLQYVDALGIPCTGVEPTAATAAVARARGLDIVEEFFGRALAARLVAEEKQADVIIALNVLAHVPSVDDFVSGISVLLRPRGVAIFEFPHLLNLIEGNQFDTIYHEHFSYFSLTSATAVLESCGLRIFDIEEQATHGGSLRVFAKLKSDDSRPVADRVGDLMSREQALGMCSPGYYTAFQENAEKAKDDFLRFLLDAKSTGKTVAGYGAAAKGSTLLNFAGVHSDLILFVADRSKAKQGRYLPGSRIPVVDESEFAKLRPDYVIIFPWNLAEELTHQLDYVRGWGGRFVTAIPRLVVH